MASYGTSQALPEPEGGLAYKWKVLISVIFGVFMIILDTTVVNVSFQTLRREYGVSLTNAQWILSIYVLALGITTPISGFLADRFGVKRMYILGLTIFVFGSAVCGLAHSISSSIWFLVGARALQGFGGGLAQPLGSSLLFSTFPPEEQGTALGFFGIALVTAPAIGPILVGYLVDLGLWQWTFCFNIPIGILGITLASRFLRTSKRAGQAAFDPIGIVTSTIGVGSVLYAATQAAEHGWTSGTVLTWFAIGAAALAAFAITELFIAKQPMLNLRLFGNRIFLNSNLVGYVGVLALFGAEFLMPVYLQALRGRTALQTGFILLPLALAAGITTPIAGKLYDKVGPRILIVTGFAILLINTWQLSLIKADTPISWLLFLLALRGLAVGMTVQTTFATSLASVPKPQLNRGSSLINSSRFIVQSIGVAILATVLAGALSPQVKAFGQQAQQGQQQNAATVKSFGVCETPGVAAADNFPPGAAASLKQLPAPAQAAARTQIQNGLHDACAQNLLGFEHAYRLTFYAALVAMLLGMLLPGWPFNWAGRGSMSAAPTPAH
ncbi:MAG: DHA2 family efflux MFS transporter permease subunit [Herpetosiphon sp.]